MLDVATDFPSAVLHDEVQEGFEVPPDADKLRGKYKDVRRGKLRTSGPSGGRTPSFASGLTGRR